MQTRGLRNNNPGNIDYSVYNKWVGQIGIETGVQNPRFAVFDTAENGIRALVKILRAYNKKYGAETISAIVSRYAPKSENKTDTYAANVSKWAEWPENKPIDFNNEDLMLRITKAFIRMENGFNPYTPEVYLEGVRRGMK